MALTQRSLVKQRSLISTKKQLVTASLFLAVIYSVICISYSPLLTPPSPSTEERWEDVEYDICSIGAGLSGSVIAQLYASLKGKKVLVLEQRNHIGGNCFDYLDKKTGILVSKYGAHLFHTNYERVWEYIQKFAKWVPYEHRVLAKVQGKHVPVPVNIDTVNILFGTSIETPEEMKFWLEKETGSAKAEEDWKTVQPKNSEEMAISRVGKRLYELIFHPYTIKQWDKEPSELGPEVTARIPVRDNYDDRYFSDKYQYLPEGGYTKFFERLLDHRLITVITGVNYFDVKDKLKCEKVYYSGPIDTYYADLGLERLEYRGLDFERRVERNTTLQPLSVVNHPSLDVNYTRIVEYKHLLNQTSPHTIYFLEHSRADGEPYYPVPNEANQALYRKYQKMAEKETNVSFIGRLATYKYYNMDQAIYSAMKLFDKDTGYQYMPEGEPESIPEPDWSKPISLHSKLPSPKRRVVIDGKSLYYFSGGPEAMIQLCLSFKAFLPEGYLFWLDANEPNTQFHAAYNSSRSIPVIHSEDLIAGDILILPEIQPCPKDLVEKGVQVYIWLLAHKPDRGRLANGCKMFSHNFWLAGNHDSTPPDMAPVEIPTDWVVRPYVSETLKPRDWNSSDKKENLVLIDNDSPDEIRAAVEGFCQELGCNATVVIHFQRSALPDLFDRAKIVIDWCMRGSERMPLESSLRGAILVTSPCQCGSDFRDYPIPQRNVVSDAGDALKDAMKRILTNWEKEYEDNARFRQLYTDLNATTMMWETKTFYYSISGGSEYSE